MFAFVFVQKTQNNSELMKVFYHSNVLCVYVESDNSMSHTNQADIWDPFGNLSLQTSQIFLMLNEQLSFVISLPIVPNGLGLGGHHNVDAKHQHYF